MGRIISLISYYVNRKTVKLFFFTAQKWSTGTLGDFVLAKDRVLRNLNTDVTNQ